MPKNEEITLDPVLSVDASEMRVPGRAWLEFEVQGVRVVNLHLNVLGHFGSRQSSFLRYSTR